MGVELNEGRGTLRDDDFIEDGVDTVDCGDSGVEFIVDGSVEGAFFGVSLRSETLNDVLDVANVFLSAAEVGLGSGLSILASAEGILRSTESSLGISDFGVTESDVFSALSGLSCVERIVILLLLADRVLHLLDLSDKLVRSLVGVSSDDDHAHAQKPQK